MGYLTGVRKRNALLIDSKGLRHFNTTYIRVHSVAKKLRTHPRELMRFCRTRQIPMVVCTLGKNGRQAFVSRKDEPMLRHYRTSKMHQPETR